MKIAWFTPVTGDGAIAEYSRMVLAEIARLGHPTLFCDRPPERFPAELPTVIFAALPESRWKLDTYDAIFYNLGNDWRQHARMFDLARGRPGIVILHNPTVHRFFLDYYLQHLSRPDLYAQRMALHYGAAGVETAHRVLGPWFDPRFARAGAEDLDRYTFTEEALRSALGTVVHSRWHGRLVREVWDGPVLEAWLPTPPLSGTRLSSDGWYGKPDRAHTTLMTIDPVERGHGVTEVIDALASDSDLAVHARYVIAGRDDLDEAYVREVNAAIAAHGLARCVRLLGRVLPATLERRAAAADVFVNLRDPHDEGCSASLMYELAHGKPVVVYDSGPFSELPDEAVAKVPPGDPSALRRTLRELVHSPARRKALGALGRQFAASHRVHRHTRDLLEFAHATVSSSVCDRIVTQVGEVLASLAIDPDSDALACVTQELRALLTPTVE